MDSDVEQLIGELQAVRDELEVAITAFKTSVSKADFAAALVQAEDAEERLSSALMDYEDTLPEND